MMYRRDTYQPKTEAKITITARYAKAKQLAADDFANGEITKDQINKQIKAYYRWLAEYHS